MESEFPDNMHIYTLFLIAYTVYWKAVQWFRRSCAWQAVTYFFNIYVQNSKFKEANSPPQKKKTQWNRKILIVMHTYKLSL